jgi:orotidine-5'-phosphate decarboxylase
MPTDFANRLAAAVRRRGPLCVGLDPRAESLPAHLLAAAGSVPAAFEAFCLRVLDLVEPFAGVVKPQAAFFEQYGAAGMAAMGRVLAAARERGFVTILDAKRGDIASTAAAYAHAAFAPDVWAADAVTVNPYLGADAVEPFVTAAVKHRGGLFVLVRTSNPGGGLFQNLDCGGRPLYRAVADAVAAWNAPTLGDCGLGAVGAVVGATNPRELAELRAALPDAWLLVPGYGAQGATAADCRAAFRPDGLGAVVNSSRGVTFPFAPADPEWEAKIVAAARQAHLELSDATRS